MTWLGKISRAASLHLILGNSLGILKTPPISLTEIVKKIKLLLLENIKTSRIKEKKKNNEGDKKSEPWFDSECKKKKDEITKLGKKIQKSPKDQSLRTVLSNEKKSFRRIVLVKKRNY